MKEPYNIITKESVFEETFDLKKLVGKKVLSKDGLVVGKIIQIRIDPHRMVVQGILVSGGDLGKNLYIGKSYFNNFSDDAVILNINPSPLLIDRKVLDHEGNNMGRVRDVYRRGSRNDIDELVVRSFLRKDFTIRMSQVKNIGRSIILKPRHNVKKKYFWQKSD